MKIFHFQMANNAVYRDYVQHLGVDADAVTDVNAIPFLPISLFKSHDVKAFSGAPETVFRSSGTTGSVQSQHLVKSLALYEQSFQKALELFYPPSNEWCVLALLPGYLERQDSSLVYMVHNMIQRSPVAESGFYLDDLDGLAAALKACEARRQPTLLIGVSFALLDLIEQYRFDLHHTIVMETGGMKGRRKELIRKELHTLLKAGFGVDQVHSEYGMTELLSQAYAREGGRFECPPWMRATTRQTNDPLSKEQPERTGGLNIIDLANVYSCPFIATEDLARVFEDGTFEVLGRFDHSDVRGCNLMVSDW